MMVVKSKYKVKQNNFHIQLDLIQVFHESYQESNKKVQRKQTQDLDLKLDLLLVTYFIPIYRPHIKMKKQHKVNQFLKNR